MAIVDRDKVGRISIMEMGLKEFMALANIIVAGSKCREVSLDELRAVQNIIEGMCGIMKVYSTEMQKANEQLKVDLEKIQRNSN